MKKKDIVAVFAWAVSLLISACQIGTISQTELRLERYAANTKDFPKGWAFVGEDWNKESGNESYSANYGVPNNDAVGFGQTISVYPDNVRAENSYLELQTKWFSGTKKWPGAEFTPLDSEDEYRYECLQFFLDKSIISCTFLQKHNAFVSLILVNVDGKLITMSQLNEVLKALDERLNNISLK